MLRPYKIVLMDLRSCKIRVGRLFRDPERSWEAYQFHKEKLLQLDSACKLGVAIPSTLISNDPEDIRAFVCPTVRSTHL